MRQLILSLVFCIACNIFTAASAGGNINNMAGTSKQAKNDRITDIKQYHCFTLDGLMESDKDIIMIRKGALEFIDKCALSFKLKKRPMKKLFFGTHECSLWNFNLSNLSGSNDMNFNGELVALLKLGFNENTHADGKIKKYPYSVTEPLTFEKIKVIINACSFLCPDLNHWFLFFRLFEKHFADVTVETGIQTFTYLSTKLNFRYAIKRTKSYPQDVDLPLFIETFILFVDIFEKMVQRGYMIQSEEGTSLVIDFLKLLITVLIITEKPKDWVLNKTGLLKAFVKLFVDLKDKISKTQCKKVERLTCLAYLAIIYLFTPSEFYDLYLDEFVYLPMFFENYLFEVLGFFEVFVAEGVLGVFGTDVSKISPLLDVSESFLAKQFREDKKVWIHFGVRTMERIDEEIDKAFLPVFWRALRNYAVLLGGDGILMTFEDENEVADNSAEKCLDIERTRIRRCGFWNLVDPSVEGKVVFTTETNINICIYSDRYGYLEINGRTNLLCPCWQRFPEIVLFCDRPEFNENECDLIQALPGCLVSESVCIVNDAGDKLDLDQITLAEIKMLDFKPFKVSVFFGGNPKLPMSVKANKYRQCRCCVGDYPYEFSEQLQAMLRIGFALERLSAITSNFRELSIELVHTEFLPDFLGFLTNLNLTTLKFTSLHCEKHNYIEKVFSTISENQFMMNNLRYLDIFPLLDPSDFLNEGIFQHLPLKKLTLYQANQESPKYNSMWKTKLKTLIYENNLEEIELFFPANRFYLRYNVFDWMKEMSLPRMTIIEEWLECAKFPTEPILSSFLIESPLKISTSFQYFFQYTSNQRRLPPYSLDFIKPEHLREHLIPLSYGLSKSALKTLYQTNRAKLFGFFEKRRFNAKDSRNFCFSRLLSIN